MLAEFVSSAFHKGVQQIVSGANGRDGDADSAHRPKNGKTRSTGETPRESEDPYRRSGREQPETD
jgi:hypothetical protein